MATATGHSMSPTAVRVARPANQASVSRGGRRKVPRAGRTTVTVFFSMARSTAPWPMVRVCTTGAAWAGAVVTSVGDVIVGPPSLSRPGGRPIPGPDGRPVGDRVDAPRSAAPPPSANPLLRVWRQRSSTRRHAVAPSPGGRPTKTGDRAGVAPDRNRAPGDGLPGSGRPRPRHRLLVRIRQRRSTRDRAQDVAGGRCHSRGSDDRGDGDEGPLRLL